MPSASRGNSEFFLFNTPYIIDWTLSYWNGLDTGHAMFTDTERVNEALNANALSRLVAGRVCRANRPMEGRWPPGSGMTR